MKITTIKTKDEQCVYLSNLTVLVGPNNVGKSQTLRDIHDTLSSGHQENASVLVEELDIEYCRDFDEAFDSLRIESHPNNTEIKRISGIASNLQQRETQDIREAKLDRETIDEDFLRRHLFPFRAAHLDAGSRLDLADSTQSHDTHNDAPSNLVQALYDADKERQEELREAFERTFDMEIRLDTSALKMLRFRIADEFPVIPNAPKEAKEIMPNFPTLETQGDGYRSFVGVVLSLLLSRKRIVLIDEPEAFLHPAQATTLGSWMAEYTDKSGIQVVVATHDANFLRGILTAETEVGIYRLNRSGDTTEFHQIPADVTRQMATDPILSSQRVIEGLFHKGVVVCEGDKDRAIYRQVAKSELEEPETLFVNAHNKGVIKRVARALNQAKIPKVAIADVDILNESSRVIRVLNALGVEPDEDWIEQECAAIDEAVENVPEADRLEDASESLENILGRLQNDEFDVHHLRRRLNDIRKNISDWGDIKDNGLVFFDKQDRDRPEAFLDDLKEMGLYVVPVGELEGWIEFEQQENTWIVEALEAIRQGNTPGQLTRFIELVVSDVRDRHDDLIQVNG